MLNQLQQSDETRIELMKEFMLTHCSLHLSLVPCVTEYILHMKESAESISPAQVGVLAVGGPCCGGSLLWGGPCCGGSLLWGGALLGLHKYLF